MAVIESEGEAWSEYSSRPNREKYKISLAKSITYVAYLSHTLCGYSRSIDDFGFTIYVCDLLVNKQYRGNAIGQQLLECITEDFPNRDIYVMSDVDDYYRKLGYKIEGSLFQVIKPQ
ncbi:GNAT family N-acetyltransferase [Flavivirga eckloniae]|uniref:GNAT family N-acetyltransferase n=2 Tax=Flavivirga eckloniae TaxID=1803846 RepID=A0A2K9PWY1_9FLAO|nr:GNAT family N-acetyltransferase [Flavivirga eckloniae]